MAKVSIETQLVPGADEVSVLGDWDDWTTSVPLFRDTKGTNFEAFISLPPGSHQYKFFVSTNKNTSWFCSPSAPTKLDKYKNLNNVVEAVTKIRASYPSHSNFGPASVSGSARTKIASLLAAQDCPVVSNDTEFEAAMMDDSDDSSREFIVEKDSSSCDFVQLLKAGPRTIPFKDINVSFSLVGSGTAAFFFHAADFYHRLPLKQQWRYV